MSMKAKEEPKTRGRTYTLVLPQRDVCQILDGIAARAESWEYTARWLAKYGPEADDADVEQYGDVDLEETRDIEECSRAREASEIAGHYREIARKIEGQIDGRKTGR
jgi:hypothetical protein